MRLTAIANGLSGSHTETRSVAKEADNSVWSVMHYFAGPLALTAVWGLSFIIAWDRLMP